MITEKYDALAATATDEVINQAKVWYSNANSIANELSEESGYSVESCASVIAAFSPLTPWDRNVNLARDFISGNIVKTIGSHIRTATRALDNGFGAINGPKTNAFARNIAGDETPVTIDSWMMKAAGMPKKKLNKTEYNELAGAVTELAPKYNMTPAQFQALVWIVIRGKAD